VGRSSNAPDDNTCLHGFVTLMINIGIAPTTRTELHDKLRVRVDDGVAVEVPVRIGQLAGLALRAGEIKELVVLPNERCQMRKDLNFVVSICVKGNGRAIEEDDIAVIDSQVIVEHAADNPVTWTEPLDPYGLLQPRIVHVRVALGERSLGKLDF